MVSGRKLGEYNASKKYCGGPIEGQSVDRRSTATPPEFHTYSPALEGLFFLRAVIPVLSSEQTSGRASHKVHWTKRENR